MKNLSKIFAASAIVFFSAGMSAQHSKVYRSHRKVATQSVKSLIVNNVGKYPVRELNIFKNATFANRVKRMTNGHYAEIVRNFNVETPIVTDGQYYKFTGCKTHDCPNFHTSVYYDPKTDNLWILVEKGSTRESYSERTRFYPSDKLQGM